MKEAACHSTILATGFGRFRHGSQLLIWKNRMFAPQIQWRRCLNHGSDEHPSEVQLASFPLQKWPENPISEFPRSSSFPTIRGELMLNFGGFHVAHWGYHLQDRRCPIAWMFMLTGKFGQQCTLKTQQFVFHWAFEGRRIKVQYIKVKHDSTWHAVSALKHWLL